MQQHCSTFSWFPCTKTHEVGGFDKKTKPYEILNLWFLVTTILENLVLNFVNAYSICFILKINVEQSDSKPLTFQFGSYYAELLCELCINKLSLFGLPGMYDFANSSKALDLTYAVDGEVEVQFRCLTFACLQLSLEVHHLQYVWKFRELFCFKYHSIFASQTNRAEILTLSLSDLLCFSLVVDQIELFDQENFFERRSIVSSFSYLRVRFTCS